jgi:hypothetical protein
MKVSRYLLLFLRYLLTLLIVGVIIVVVIIVAIIAWYLLVVGMLFLLIYWYRKVHTPIKVVVLGFPNAGKTVFLASMYRRLATPGQAGCVLDMKPEQRKKLIGVYDQIADTEKDFPPSTAPGETTEWSFTGRVQSLKRFYPVFKFSYLDYAGERGRDLFKLPYTSFGADFEKTLRKADILLGVLDGQEVLRFMRGQEGEQFHRDLQNMLIIMTNSEKPKPIHFILTKWDLLEGTYSLSQVLEGLERIDPFRNFVTYQTQSSTLRLIPVSALGKGFAREENGVMKKSSAAQIHPFQVEMPLVCSLLDYSEAEVRKLKTATERLGASSKSTPWYTPLLAVLLASTVTIQVGIITVNFGSFKDLLHQHSLDKREPPGEEKRTPEARIRNRREARRYMYRQFFSLLDLLEKCFPESNLSNLKRGSRT